MHAFFLPIKGFSLGDELGFPESLGNVEGSRRRALNLKTSSNAIGKAVAKPSNVSSVQCVLIEYINIIVTEKTDLMTNDLGYYS